MSPCIYFSFVLGEALELANILLFGIPIYLTLSCIKIWIKKKKRTLPQRGVSAQLLYVYVVHDGDHDSVFRIFVGLSYEL